MMEIFAKIVNSWKLLTVFTKNLILMSDKALNTPVGFVNDVSWKARNALGDALLN